MRFSLTRAFIVFASGCATVQTVWRERQAEAILFGLLRQHLSEPGVFLAIYSSTEVRRLAFACSDRTLH